MPNKFEIAPKSQIKLGVGLIKIGREWGYAKSTIPSEDEVSEFLNFAVDNGIDFFDTAPAYGTSEEQLGKFLASLTIEKRNSLTIATKFGERWDSGKNQSFVDHRYTSLSQSLDQSFERLGKIDILQLHKATVQTLQNTEVKKAFAYAQERGVKIFGASVSDPETGNLVCQDIDYSIIQLPYNIINTSLEIVIDNAQNHNKTVIINRPYNMGAILYNQPESITATSLRTRAYEFIIRRNFHGVILTGTNSPKHLLENLQSFNSAMLMQHNSFEK